MGFPVVTRVGAVCLLLFSQQVLSQTPDSTRLYQMEEVIVLANRSEKNINDVGRSVSVVSKEEIHRAVFGSAAAVLSTLPGIYIVGERQNPGALQNLYTRGANANQTLIMVDGIRVSDPSSPDDALDLSELSLTDVEKIEVVRGAHSPLYGSSAIGGVVNFITTRNVEEGFHVQTNLRGGVFGPKTSTLSENVSLDYRTHGLSLRTGVLNSGTRGLDATIDTVTTPGTFKNRHGYNSKRVEWIGKLDYQDERFDVFGSFRSTTQDKDLPRGAFQDDDNHTVHSTRDLFSFGGAYALSGTVKVNYTGGFSNANRHYVNDSSVVNIPGNTDKTYSEDKYTSKTSSHDLQFNVGLKNLTLILGYGYYRASMAVQSYYYSDLYGPPAYVASTDLSPLDLHSTLSALFFHVDLGGRLITDALQPFSLIVGGRWNRHNQYGVNTTFEVGLSSHITDRTLAYGSYTSGFNAPTLYQLYAPDRNFASDITRGNPSLQPEESRSFEIGLRHTLADLLIVNLSYYHSVVEHSIEYVYLWDRNISIGSLGTDYLRDDYRGDTYLNVGRQTSDGFEVSVATLFSDRFSFSVNASIVKGKLEYHPSNVDGRHTGGNHVQLFSNGAFLDHTVEDPGLVRRPSTLNLQCSYRVLDRVFLHGAVKFVGNRNDITYNSLLGPYGALGTVGVSHYMLTDFSAKYVFNSNVSATLFVENLFNVKYSEIIGYTTRGRGVYGQLQIGL